MKFLQTIILIFLCLPIFAQYGNIKIIEPNKTISSENPKTEMIVSEGFAGVFVEVLKDSKVKITVSAKCSQSGYNYPIMKLSCENQSTKYIIRNHEYLDYSANFSLKKGIHFIKAEFIPILKDPKKAEIERFFVSGNNYRYIEKPNDKTILDSCHINAKSKINYGKITKSKDPLLEKTYDILINEESDLNTDYIEILVDCEDIFAQKNLYRELIKNNNNENFRIFFNSENEIKLKDLFMFLNYIKVYGKNIEIYDLKSKNTEHLLNIIKICKSLNINSVILGEETPVFPIKH